jgi:4'-phosphopantetheinyl transferase
MLDVDFSPPPPHLPLLPALFSEDVVHVWRVSLVLHSHHVQQLRGHLSADERARADRFRFNVHRDRFVVARGMLRVILGRYLDQSPERLEFCHNPYGKPALKPLKALDAGQIDKLANVNGRSPLHFNVSHAQEMALYALAWDRPLGVDLEYVQDRGADLASRIVRFFSSSEQEAFQKLPPEERNLAFFKGWTRKEAYMKARGLGFTLPLQKFDVSIAPHEPARLLADRHDPQAVGQWTLQDLDPGCGYVAALAARGAGWHTMGWQWPEATAAPG